MVSVMIVGNGAREHVISCAYEKSDASRIIVTPGNDLIPFKREKEVIIDKNCSLDDPASILERARHHKPDLIEISQDDSLAAGAVDKLQSHGFTTFGPTRKAARIEWDKRWSREFMAGNNVPHPHFRYFTSHEAAKTYVRKLYETCEPLIYVKAAGLCSGKGALKSTTLEEALGNIEEMQSFGEAGRVFLIEQGLRGEEFSSYAICDGQSYLMLPSAQDNKTLNNFDEGDQTGGMGAISPAMAAEPLTATIEEQMVKPIVKGLNEEGIPYTGIMFIGGILTDKLMNIEYNARWGDPECQVVLPAIKTDYLHLVSSAIQQRLHEVEVVEDDLRRVCVVGAARGYPHEPIQGKQIFGLEDAMKQEGVAVYGGGIKRQDDKFYSDGGRLFSVVGEGRDILEAQERAYCAMTRIKIEGNNLHYRTDIGWRDVERHLEESS
ncbi:MAG: phosphoribosylamine--glycine ligase [Nanobdellota archaeon]